MKAVLCKALGPPDSLVLEEVPSPLPGPGQVVVSVQAAGVNFPDTLIIEGKYQFKPPLPFSPGAEYAGLVKEVGAGVASFRPGDPVVGFAPFGAFAEEVLAEAAAVALRPGKVEARVAAAFAMAYGTAHHALKDRAQLRAGETLLVLGAAGGVGLAAVELGKKAGARVIAAASSAEKREVCRRAGADEVVDYGAAGWRDAVKALVGERGVDVVYDPVGGPYTEPALRLMAWRGRYLVIGFAAGDIPKIPLNLPLLKGFSVVGVFWGSFLKHQPADADANMKQLLGWLAAGEIEPLVSAEYPLSGAARALKDLAARKVTGKVVLVTGR